jgi:hypothetical protein
MEKGQREGVTCGVRIRNKFLPEPVVVPGFVSEEPYEGVKVIQAVLHWCACETPPTLTIDLEGRER